MKKSQASRHIPLSDLYHLSKYDAIADPVIVTHLRACHD